jgi:membrane-associated phospholipid phosphatase
MTLLFDDWNWDVAWQMTLLNWQGVAVMGAINRLTHDLIARDRPLLEGCKEYGPDYADPCDDDGAWGVHSFIGGHAASVYFGAGATCAHHLALELYGHPVADIGICALILGAATTSGVSRMVADAHWLSDTVIGALVGLGSGFGLAYGLHYATPLQKLETAGMMLIPVVSGESAELRLVGSL